MSRSVRARIDLDGLRSNFDRVRALAPGARVMAALKADAYGHGAVRVARALEGAHGFALARLGEALELRDAGVKARLLLLGGVFDEASLGAAARASVEIAVHDESQLALLERARTAPPVRVWLKLDTGMHRLGFEPAAAVEILGRLRAASAVSEVAVVMSHLACADDANSALTSRQCAAFGAAADALGLERSLANSAGIVAWPASHGDWVRPGIMLYGASPMLGGVAADHDLRPVMTLETCLIAVKRVRRGEHVGYGATFECARDTVVGIAGAGYADGYPRHAPSGTPVLVAGQRVPLAGRVSMDMLAVDLGPDSRARVGDTVTLWGEGLPVETVARAAETIPYELTCGISGRARIEMVERSAGAPAATAAARR